MGGLLCRRHGRPIILVRALTGLALFVVVAGVVSAGDEGGEISRRILGLYNKASTENADPHNSDLHNFLEMPINHLGLVIDYADINEPLPDVSPYRAVIVWPNTYETERPEQLLPWLLEARRLGKRLILPSGLYPPRPPGGAAVDYPLVQELLASFGLQPGEELFEGRMDTWKLIRHRPELFSFETDVWGLDGVSPVMRSTDPRVEVWLEMGLEDNPDARAVLMAVGDFGAWVMNDSLICFSTDVPEMGYRVAWNIDPFSFLEIALDWKRQPRPDVTTFWGTRGAYAHTDVDGPYNMTQPDVPGPSRMALEVVLEEVWQKYPYPVTLGFIAAEYNPDIDLRFIMPGETREQTLARERDAWEPPQSEIAGELRRLVREIYKLPHIQSGCHAYSHPLDWRNLVSGYAIRGYVSTYELEVRGAVEYLNREVLPPDKPVELYQWSGDCDPPEEPLAILAEMGLSNINGGDPLYDSRFDSVYFVCPLSRPVGARRQIYSSGSNENIYTDGWLGYRGSYNNVTATFERSESPRRLLPVNIYYHVFPAERLEGYLAIQHAYDWVSRRELCWMRALEYVKAAESFFRARIGETGDGGWWVEDYGTCPSLRFDREDRRVDLDASRNVAGYNHHNGSLYVSLIPGARAEIRFASGAVDRPCLARSSGMVENIRAEKTSWKAGVRVWGPGFVELWAPEGEWTATAAYPDGSVHRDEARRLDDGRVRFVFPDAAGGLVEIGFEG